MKKTIIFAVSMLFVVSFAQADLTTTYGVNINDRSGDSGNTSLYQLFNNYFDLKRDDKFLSSNQLFNTLGVSPYTDWTTSGSKMVGAFKVAAASHEMSIINSATGETIDTFYHSKPTNGNGGWTNISNISLNGIADGLHLDFGLTTKLGNDTYNLSSNPDNNNGVLGQEKVTTWWNSRDKDILGDGKNHMIALDITDYFNDKYDSDNDSVFMFGWEDLLADRGADWDYQDFVFIMTNILPTNPEAGSSNGTPEPATLAVLGLGLAGLGMVSRRRRK